MSLTQTDATQPISQDAAPRRVLVTLGDKPSRQYEVVFDAGVVSVIAVFARKPVNRRGHYQPDTGSRRISASGPTGRAAIAAAEGR